MIRYLRLILLFLRVSIQNDAAYRFEFVMRAVSSVVHVGAELVALWIIFSNTRGLNGWTVYHVLGLLGVYRIMVGFIGLVIAPNMRAIMDDIRQGTLDYVLLRPVSSQFLASIRRIVAWRVSDIALGLMLTAWASWKILHSVVPSRGAVFLGMLIAGAAIIYSIWLVLATLSFWFTRIANIEMVFWNVFEVGRYPITVYPPWLRWILTFIIPMAFVTTVPAQALLAPIGGGTLAAAVVLPAIMLLASSWFWRYGLRHYGGASA